MIQIHLIGGEKGGVGKSVMARVLAQYYIDREIPFQVFDADLSHGAMSRYYGDYTEAVDLGRFESADRIIEQAAEAGLTTIVDMAAQSSRQLDRWISEAGLLELAAELELGLTFWHVMDDGADSLKLFRKLLDGYGETARYVVVRNFGRGSDFSVRYLGGCQTGAADGRPVDRPARTASTHDAQDRPYRCQLLGRRQQHQQRARAYPGPVGEATGQDLAEQELRPAGPPARRVCTDLINA
jgi:hypothetical protein